MKQHEKELLLAAITFVAKDSDADVSATLESLDFEDSEAVKEIGLAIYKAFGYEVTERTLTKEEYMASINS